MATIREATSADLDRIYEITAAAFGPFCMAKLVEDRFGMIDGKPWAEHKGREVVDGCVRDLKYVIVAEEDSRVVGYATVVCKGSVGRVGNNAVDPCYQGRGIGSALIREVLALLEKRGAVELVVTTQVHDHPARRVYEKMGFCEYKRTSILARKVGEAAERAMIDLEDREGRRRLAAEGYELMTEEVHYRMWRQEGLVPEAGDP